MKKLLLTVIIVLSLIGCSAAKNTSGSIIDMAGRTIELSEPVTSVVALAPADCEIVYALGAEDLLVGRGEYCDYPGAALELPIVATGGDTNIEQIISLNPSLVIMDTMAQSEEQVRQLERAGVKVAVTDADSISEVYDAITLIGTVIGKPGSADALIADMKREFDDLEAVVETDDTIYFEVSPLESKLWTAGGDTFMTEIAEMVGLENAFADVEGWAEISEEQVIDRNPDYIVTIAMDYGEGPNPVDEIKSRRGWEEIDAVKNDNVWILDSNELTRPGPRLTNAAKSLLELLNEGE
ncbi:MAG: helical backbone metal receptor [Clostridiales bacterium]|jgi:iron complex transport system substrate-binding protein|nr:helical backbone metal receptor [Clostridiales bacterium]